MKIIFSSPFIRAFRKFLKQHPQLDPISREKVEMFKNDPYHPSLHNHKLGGNLEGSAPFLSLLFTDISDHDEVY